jgi:hypothetical protein
MSVLPPPTDSIVDLPVAPPLAASDPAPLLFLVVTLLRELRGQADILECTLLAPEDRYAISLHAPREMSTAVLLPRRPLERALGDPVARTRVRNLLRSALDALLRGRATGRAPHLGAYFTALGVHSMPGPRCGYCEGPLLAEDPVVVRESARWHLACPPAW